MAWSFLKPLQPFYRKYKEPLLYLFFGGLVFLLSIISFWFFVYPCSMQPLIANIITWVICVAFAYATNRTWVFEQKAYDSKGIIRDVISFTTGRLVTLALEELILWLGITVLGVNDIVVKIIAQIIVIIGNYIISKWFVFRT